MWKVNYLNTLITLLFFITLFGTAKFIITYTKSKEIKHVNLLKNIDQKIFMTAWLGFSFAGLFLILCYFLNRSLDKTLLLTLFNYGKKNPATFFYLGGVLFASTAILIYIIRRIGILVYCRMEKAKKNK